MVRAAVVPAAYDKFHQSVGLDDGRVKLLKTSISVSRSYSTPSSCLQFFSAAQRDHILAYGPDMLCLWMTLLVSLAVFESGIHEDT